MNKKTGLWVLAMLAAIALFTAPVTFFGRVWFVFECAGADLTDFCHPMRSLLTRSLPHGRVPLWTSHVYAGFPVMADGESGVFFPPNWVGPWDHPARAQSITIVLLIAIAGLAAFHYARTLGIEPCGAAAAGATWALSGHALSNIVHANILGGSVFLPFALAFVEESLAQSRPRRLIWIAPVLALSFYAGVAQMTYLTALTCAGALAVSPLRVRPAHWGWLVAAGALAALLAGPQLFPMAEFFRLSDRAGGLSAADRSSGSLEPRMLAQWLHPFLMGDVSRLGTPFPEDGVFPWTHSGFLAVPALLWYVTTARRDAVARRLLALFAFGLVVSLGSHTPFWKVLAYIPGFGMFRKPMRMILVPELVLSLAVGAAIARLAASTHRPHRLAAAGVAMVQLAGLMAVSLPALPTVPAADFPPASPTADYLKQVHAGRIYALFRAQAWIDAYVRAQGWRGDPEPWYRYFSLLHPEVNLSYGLASVQGHTGFWLERSEVLAFHLLRRPIEFVPQPVPLPAGMANLLRMLAVTHITSVRPLADPALSEVFRTRFDWEGFQVRVYELAEPCPRARIVGQAIPGGDQAGVFRLLNRPGHDSNAVTVLDGELPMSGTPGKAGVANIRFQDDRAMIIDLSADRAAQLVLADTYYPGWEAYVDGEPTPIARADLVCRAVAVPAGRHRVVMLYNPNALAIGTFAMVVGLALFAVTAQGRPDKLEPR